MDAFLAEETVQRTLCQRMDRPPKNDPSQVPSSGQQYSEPLVPLVQSTCAEPIGSPQRQRGLTRIIRALNGKLWHTYDAYYADALQQTWIYFCRNLCEANTGKVYNPEVAKLTTWLNAYLKRRLQDFQIAEIKQRATTVSNIGVRNDSDTPLDPIDRLPAPADIPPWLEQVRLWAEADVDGSLKAAHISKHTAVTAQVLILKRLPPETPWKVLSAEYGISVGTLSSFYQRQCLTRLREFGQSQGYF